MEIRRRHIAFLLLILAFTIATFYFFWLRTLVTQAYKGDAPVWFMSLTEMLYPRFEVEKQRFELAFFQNKADQVIIRLSGILLLTGIAMRVTNVQHFITRNSRSLTEKQMDRLRQIFYLGLLFFTWDWYRDFPRLVKMEAFYKGVHLFRILQIDIPPVDVLYGIFSVYILSILLVLFNYHKVIFAVSTAMILVLLQGFLFSFEKIEHGYATLTYACMLMPGLFFETNQASREGPNNSFILFLIQFTITGAYFLSGAEKLLTSGFEWASSDTLSAYLLMHPKKAGLWLIEQPILLGLLPWLILVFQLSSIVVPFYPRLRFFFIFSGVAFHWGTTLLMGIGTYLSPWIFVYIFFLDLDKLNVKSLGKVSKINSSQNDS